MFHFRHRKLNDRDAIDERRKNKPRGKTSVVVEMDEENDSDCDAWGL